jgi:hypothetical protein
MTGCAASRHGDAAQDLGTIGVPSGHAVLQTERLLRTYKPV